jgi:hypothetical protein
VTKIDGKGNLFLKPEMLTTGSAVPMPWKSSLPKYIDGDGFPSGNKTGVQYKLTPVLPLSAPQNSPVEEAAQTEVAAAASPTAAASLTAAAATKAPASERAATAKEAAPTEEAAAALLTAAAATEAPATERAELA